MYTYCLVHSLNCRERKSCDCVYTLNNAIFTMLITLLRYDAIYNSIYTIVPVLLRQHCQLLFVPPPPPPPPFRIIDTSFNLTTPDVEGSGLLPTIGG